MQDCRGKFLVKKGSHQKVCYNELIRNEQIKSIQKENTNKL